MFHFKATKEFILIAFFVLRGKLLKLTNDANESRIEFGYPALA